MPDTIAIAMSGGIDSLMTAAILKDQGYPVIGMHFLTGFETPGDGSASLGPGPNDHGSAEMTAVRRLQPMVDQLEIPLHIIDMRAEFKRLVVDYFIRTYQAGKTPNPCMRCNPTIKFGHLMNSARQYGASRLATGHYARLENGPNGRIRLLRGVDANKDQSYFLARLTQAQLQSAVLPLGSYTKDQVRRMAADRDLRPAAAQESQDVCFIRDGRYGAFLKQQPGFSAEPGPIVDVAGKTLGRHNGLHLFTIGQRRGINCPADAPFYVLRIEPEHNRLVVGRKEDLSTRCFTAEAVNWIAPRPLRPISIEVRVRYRHTAVPAILTPVGDDMADIVFDTPHPAVSPGQGAVFYHDQEVLGGGWIQ